MSIKLPQHVVDSFNKKETKILIDVTLSEGREKESSTLVPYTFILHKPTFSSEMSTCGGSMKQETLLYC